MAGAYQTPISLVQLRDLIDQGALAKPDALSSTPFWSWGVFGMSWG